MMYKTFYKIFFLFSFILLINIFFQDVLYSKEAPKSDDVNVNKDVNPKINYKVVRSKLYILPIKPLTVIGLNKVYALNDHSKIDYIVYINANTAKYAMLIDDIKVDKKDNVTVKEKNNLLAIVPINIYLDEDIDVTFRVKKVNLEAAPIKSFPVKYFLLLNNRNNDDFLSYEEHTVNIDLNKDNKVYHDKVKVKVQFLERFYNSIEILLGIKLTPYQYSNVKMLKTDDK